jgi:DNA (cytosine-5)-methyltransferase 1
LNNQGLNAVSLFSGIGGFEIAFQRVGIQTVATSEIDKSAQGVLKHHFPESKHFGDVTKVSGNDFRTAGFVPDRGILVGGFPCQDLSLAGKGAGLAGGRSELYWEIPRLLEELSPKYFIVENVPGLLYSDEGRDFGAILGSLVVLGYGVSYRILDSRFFGVPQHRRRIFIVGRLGDNGESSARILSLAEGVPRDTPGVTKKQEAVTDDFGRRIEVARIKQFGYYEVDGTFSSLKRRDFKGPTDLVFGNGVRRLTPLEHERLQGFPDDWTKYRTEENGNVKKQIDRTRYQQLGNAVTVPVVQWIAEQILEEDARS